MIKFVKIRGSKKDTTDEVKMTVGKKDEIERKDLAGNKNTPVEVLAMLASDEDWQVRREIAHNKNTPVEVLEKLASDEDWRVREGVAWNEKISVKILKKLALDRREVRYAVLMNKNAQLDLVKQIKLENEREDTERKRMETEEYHKKMKRVFPDL